MPELKRILQAYDEAVLKGKKTALATVVHVEGSSYRRPGARMLVDDEGYITGAISGGCLEGDALKKAMLVITKQQAKLVKYDTSNENDALIGIQLGCEGIIYVLFEPIDPVDRKNPIELIRKALIVRKTTVLVTFFNITNKQDPQIGTSLLFDDQQQILLERNSTIHANALKNDILQTLKNQSSHFYSYQHQEETIQAFVEFLSLPISLVIVGAGNDALPLMKFADTLDWEVRIVDGRVNYAKPEKFEAACQVLVAAPEQILEKIDRRENTAFILVTHNYNYDKAVLKYLLPLDLKYVGVLGPRKKLNRILDDLKDEGMQITDEMLTKVYGPTGLDLGAETPAEIALSIIAEIQAVFQEKSGASLRNKTEVIHDRTRNMFQFKTIGK